MFDIHIATIQDSRSPLMLYNPERDIPYICDGPFAADVIYNQLTDDNLTGTIGGVPYSCNGSYDNPENPWYGYFEDSPAVADCGRTIANNCDDLKNILNVNRPGTSDIEREGWEVNAALEITDGLVLEYVYGENQLYQNTSRDLDLTNQIEPPTPNGEWYDRRNDPHLKWKMSLTSCGMSNFDSKLNFVRCTSTRVLIFGPCQETTSPGILWDMEIPSQHVRRQDLRVLPQTGAEMLPTVQATRVEMY